MTTVQTSIVSGADGLLTVVVPVEQPNREYRVVVTIQPKVDDNSLPGQNAEEAPVPRMEAGHLVTGRGWPLGFFERTIGVLADDPIERGLQGEYELRESIE